MYLRIIRPLPLRLDGFDLTAFVLHGAYDVGAPLSELLVGRGFAIPATYPPMPSREAAFKAMSGGLIAGCEPGETIEIAADRAPSKRRSRSH